MNLPPLPLRNLATQMARARVLVVDDELRLREGLAGLLRVQHVVETAASASEALDRLRSGAQFDVILADVMMPGASGVDLYESIQREFPLQACRVVFMTGGLREPFRARIAALPNVCLQKPMDLTRLRSIVRGAVASSRGATDAIRAPTLIR
jgi:CheY-like chemotaxis protein